MNIRPYRPEDKEKILEIQRRQLAGWHGREPATGELGDPDSPLSVVTVILEDDDGEIVAALGAVTVVEIFMAIDASNRDLRSLFDNIIKGWAKIILELHRKGYTIAVARIGPHIKKWANTAVKRFGFRRLNTESLWFDIQKECEDARRKVS